MVLQEFGACEADDKPKTVVILSSRPKQEGGHGEHLQLEFKITLTRVGIPSTAEGLNVPGSKHVRVLGCYQGFICPPVGESILPEDSEGTRI